MNFFLSENSVLPLRDLLNFKFLLQKAGITFKVDNKLPNLVNLNEDPQLSEMLLYVIKEGQTRVGRMCPSSKHEIQLNGALIADNHWLVLWVYNVPRPCDWLNTVCSNFFINNNCHLLLINKFTATVCTAVSSFMQILNSMTPPYCI